MIRMIFGLMISVAVLMLRACYHLAKWGTIAFIHMCKLSWKMIMWMFKFLAVGVTLMAASIVGLVKLLKHDVEHPEANRHPDS